MAMEAKEKEVCDHICRKRTVRDDLYVDVCTSCGDEQVRDVPMDIFETFEELIKSYHHEDGKPLH